MSKMSAPDEAINVLLVDDQPAKLLSYEAVLSGCELTLLKATTAREALEHLLRHDVALILMDVCMPETDGFELAAMIRDHPRYRTTAIIFVSAINVTDLDRLRGYEAGAVDYVPVPVVPEVLRAKVRIFAELYRKTRALERLNDELERRVAERTAALEEAASRLRESEQRRTLALAAAGMGSWIWNPVSETIIWDEGQRAIFGVPTSFIPTLDSIYALIHPDDLHRLREADHRAAERSEAYEIEFRIVRPNGEVRWCAATAAPSIDAEGHSWFGGVALDITERKRSQLALQQMNEELEQRIEERTREREHALAQLFESQKLDTIGHLTGGVAHDFNNLLMAILSSLELLRKRLAPDPRIDRLIENAIQGAERGAALTQRLLAFARRQELKPRAVDVAALIRGMESLLERAVQPGVRLVCDFASGIPPVVVDPNQLELALLNLAVNASDAMPNGGEISFSIACADAGQEDVELSPGAYVRVRVTDTGSGMCAETLAKALQPFFTTKGPGKGTGLGLSMVHGLAAQSGGSLRLSSEIGTGTTVDLWLPQGTGVEEPEAPVPQMEDVRIGPPTARKILLVDDDLLVSAGTVAMLEDLGHSVVATQSGSEALDLLATHAEVDLVISDYAMPEMTGLELIAEIQTRHPKIAVLLVTGFAELPPERSFGLSRLGKPFRQEELASAIHDVQSTVMKPADFPA